MSPAVIDVPWSGGTWTRRPTAVNHDGPDLLVTAVEGRARADDVPVDGGRSAPRLDPEER